MRRILTLVLFFSGSLVADPIAYLLHIDTSSISSFARIGAIEISLNPNSSDAQAATFRAYNAPGDIAFYDFPKLTGDATGLLSDSANYLTIDNGRPDNSYLQKVMYVSGITFNFLLSGPALAAPNGTAAAGSTLTFSAFDDAAATVPVLTSRPDGVLFTVAVNLDGTTTVTNYSTETSIRVGSEALPEPSHLTAIGAAALALLALRARKKRSYSSFKLGLEQ